MSRGFEPFVGGAGDRTIETNVRQEGIMMEEFLIVKVIQLTVNSHYPPAH